jgi:hypothetical protein
MAASSTVETYHLHVKLSDSDPAIWRRVCVQSDTSLADLHRVLAAVMGWSGEADYVFKVPSQILADGEAPRSEIGPKGPILSSLLTQIESSFLYTYSPAQGWLHKVTLESIGPTEDPVPHCTAGERRCPLEFCNGIWDYIDLLDRLEDSSEPDGDELWQRIGYDFDAEAFDRAIANQRLQGLGRSILA